MIFLALKAILIQNVFVIVSHIFLDVQPGTLEGRDLIHKRAHHEFLKENMAFEYCFSDPLVEEMLYKAYLHCCSEDQRFLLLILTMPEGKKEGQSRSLWKIFRTTLFSSWKNNLQEGHSKRGILLLCWKLQESSPLGPLLERLLLHYSMPENERATAICLPCFASYAYTQFSLLLPSTI